MIDRIYENYNSQVLNNLFFNFKNCHNGTLTIIEWTVTNPQYADDIHALD